MSVKRSLWKIIFNPSEFFYRSPKFAVFSLQKVWCVWQEHGNKKLKIVCKKACMKEKDAFNCNKWQKYICTLQNRAILTTSIDGGHHQDKTGMMIHHETSVHSNNEPTSNIKSHSTINLFQNLLLASNNSKAPVVKGAYIALQKLESYLITFYLFLKCFF